MSLQFTRLFETINWQQKNYPQSDAVCFKESSGWKKYSTADCIEIINRISASLLKRGLNAGDRIAIISPNRPEWLFTDAGLLQAGFISIPVYPTISEEEYKYIFH